MLPSSWTERFSYLPFLSNPRFDFQFLSSLFNFLLPKNLLLLWSRCWFGSCIIYVLIPSGFLTLFQGISGLNVFPGLSDLWMIVSVKAPHPTWQYLPVWSCSMPGFWGIPIPLFLNLASLFQLGDSHSSPFTVTTRANSWWGFTPQGYLVSMTVIDRNHVSWVFSKWNHSAHHLRHSNWPEVRGIVREVGRPCAPCKCVMNNSLSVVLS